MTVWLRGALIERPRHRDRRRAEIEHGKLTNLSRVASEDMRMRQEASSASSRHTHNLARVLRGAEGIARARGSSELEPTHLFESLIQRKTSVAATVLVDLLDSQLATLRAHYPPPPGFWRSLALTGAAILTIILLMCFAWRG